MQVALLTEVVVTVLAAVAIDSVRLVETSDACETTTTFIARVAVPAVVTAYAETSKDVTLGASHASKLQVG
jgi:hypothetical protein